MDTSIITPVNEDVVKALEDLLQQARDGDFNGFAIVTLTSPTIGGYEACGTDFFGTVAENVHIALGGLEILNRRMLDSYVIWYEQPMYKDEEDEDEED